MFISMGSEAECLTYETGNEYRNKLVIEIVKLTQETKRDILKPIYYIVIFTIYKKEIN
jgi:hypothetical protein